MNSPCPPHWTFAARAAYFGDRMCAFCGHRNPAGARFCNDCASPLHQKPCARCHAVNDEAATNCCQCGAPCAPSISKADASPAPRAVDSPREWATPGDAAAAAPVTQRPFAAATMRGDWRLPGPRPFLVAAVAAILTVASYEAYRVDAPSPDAVAVAPKPVDVRPNTATPWPPPVVMEANPAEPDATRVVNVKPVEPEKTPVVNVKPAEPEKTPVVDVKPVEPERTPVVDVKPVEPDKTAALQTPIPPAADDHATKRASVRERPLPVPAAKRASAHKRPPPQRPPAARAPRPTTHSLVAAGDGARIAKTSKALRPDPWQVMHVSLARCGGDLLTRFVCDQRVRRHFCEGHWGEAPECASGVVNEHGQ